MRYFRKYSKRRSGQAERAAEAAEMFVTGGIGSVMNAFNREEPSGEGAENDT